MKKIFFLLFAIGTGSIALKAQTSPFDPNTIPLSLKKNASSVVRSETTEFEVTDIDRGKLTVHRIVTILNENGADELGFLQIADKFHTLDDAEIKLYNASGKMIEKYRKSDMNAISLGDGLLDDAKRYYASTHATVFPVTVESSYTIRYKGILTYPAYNIASSEEGVENSNYTVKIPKELDLRFKEKNIHLVPVITEDDKYKTYSWTVKNFEAFSYETGGVSFESKYPSILLAPNHFKLDDYEGDMTSWEKFGNWYGNLQKGTDILPEERKQFFSNLVQGAATEKEKIRIVYDYLQKNFRYVSIQLGIGGFKPFSAEFTDKKKYGDCKALTNFMQTVLTGIGIKSYQALINATYNKEPVDPAFPCNQFNHVILCVPQKKDSIWLECTSRSNEFGELGNFTENRNALLITEKGGLLVATPRSKAINNRCSAFTNIVLKGDGSGTTTTLVNGTGEYKQILIAMMDEKADDQKDFAMNQWSFKDPSSIAFDKQELSGDPTMVIKQESGNIPEFKTSSKMFLSPRICDIFTSVLPGAQDRHQDYYFRCPFEKTDTTVFMMPEKYKVEALPDAKDFKNNYAHYTSKYWYDEKSRSIYSTSLIILDQYKIPAKDYASVKFLFDDILKDNSQRIVIKKED